MITLDDTPVSSLGCQNASFEYVNMDLDKARLSLAQDISAPIPAVLQADRIVTFKSGTTTLLRGRVQPAVRSAGSEQEMEVEVYGPWSAFEQTPYITATPDPLTGTPAESGLYELSGTLTQCITDIHAYARSKAPQDIGALVIDLPSITIPKLTGRDASCAQVIRQLLAWLRTAQVVFDYSTTPPRVLVLKADSVHWPAPLTPTGLAALEYRIEEREKPENVVLYYVRQASISRRWWGVPYQGNTEINGHRIVGTDAYPSATVVTRRTLAATLDLRGQQRLADIKRGAFSSSQTFAWHIQLIGQDYPYVGAMLFEGGHDMAYYDNSRYVLDPDHRWCRSVGYTFYLIRPEGDLEISAPGPVESYPLKTRDGYWNELPDKLMLESPPDNYYFYRVRITTGWATSQLGAVARYHTATIFTGMYFDPVTGQKDWLYNRTLEKIYDLTVDDLEPAPAGLAAGIYNSLDVLPVGIASIHGAPSIGSRVIQLEGRLSPIQRLTLAPASETASISFGPPEHLGPQDILELFRSNT